MARSKLLACAIVAASALATGAIAGAAQSGPRIARSVDTGLCPFPLAVTASKAGQGDAVGTTALKFSFPGSTAFRLRNGSTGRTVTLRSPGSTPVDTTTGSVTFSGHVVWGWAAGSQVPFLATDGPGKLRAPSYVLSGPARATVIDPCALVAPSPQSMQPAGTKAPWALPSYALSHMAFAHLTPLVGFLVHHDHAHLDLIVNGRKVTVPAGVGLAEPVDKGPCPKPTAPTGDCATGHVFVAEVANSPLHTHTSSGIIHIEPDRPGSLHARTVLRRMGRPPRHALPRRLLHGRRKRATHVRERQAGR